MMEKKHLANREAVFVPHKLGKEAKLCSLGIYSFVIVLASSHILYDGETF